MNPSRLLQALPISGIEAQWLARVEGFVPGKEIIFFEPPAGQHAPFVEPITVTAILLEHGGVPIEQAASMAKDLYTELRPRLSMFERPVLYTGFESDMRNIPECVPLPKLLGFYQEKCLISESVQVFLSRACEATSFTRMFRYGDFGAEARCLNKLPPLPPPKAMVEFFVGLPDNLVYENSPSCDWGQTPFNLLQDWKKSIRPLAEILKERCGEEVYYFADPDCDHDDDNCHRFLALHCWCSLLPDSSFIRYLLEVANLPDVTALRAALIDPASYTHPWKMYNAFTGMEVVPTCYFHYQYVLQVRPKRIGIIFLGPDALQRAEEVSLQHIGCELLFIGPRCQSAFKNDPQKASKFDPPLVKKYSS